MKRVEYHEFEWMWRDEVRAKVTYSFIGDWVKVENYHDNLVQLPFGINQNPKIKDLDYLMESRCFPKTRANVKEILENLGLVYYDPYSITLITHGRMMEDHHWIRRESNKHLTFEDIRPDLFRKEWNPLDIQRNTNR